MNRYKIEKIKYSDSYRIFFDGVFLCKADRPIRAIREHAETHAIFLENPLDIAIEADSANPLCTA